MGMDLASLLYEHDFDYPKDLIDELLQKHCERNALGFDAKHADILIKQVLTHRSMRCVALLNDYNKQGKLLNRKNDIDKNGINIQVSFLINGVEAPVTVSTFLQRVR